MTPVIELSNVSKTYRRGGEELLVLNDISLSALEGEFLALMGPSGSGKTTLLNLIAGLDRADNGTVKVLGESLGPYSEAQLSKWRAKNIGFVFQFYNLIPVLTALENVELVLTLFPMSKAERLERARFALSVVGLNDRENHRPSELSGGQEQRVAIARAIVTDPKILVADEPTGDLDRQSAKEIMQLFARLNSEFGKTIVMVTHDQVLAEYAKRVFKLDKGVVLDGAL